jgi:hypothetical protein
MQMEAEDSCETLVPIYKMKWRDSPEHHDLNWDQANILKNTLCFLIAFLI